MEANHTRPSQTLDVARLPWLREDIHFMRTDLETSPNLSERQSRKCFMGIRQIQPHSILSHVAAPFSSPTAGRAESCRMMPTSTQDAFDDEIPEAHPNPLLVHRQFKLFTTHLVPRLSVSMDESPQWGEKQPKSPRGSSAPKPRMNNVQRKQ